MGDGEETSGLSQRSPTSIVRGGGSRLAQITAVEPGFAGRDWILRRVLSVFFACGDEKRERKIAKMYHSLRANRSELLRKMDTKFLRNLRKD